MSAVENDVGVGGIVEKAWFTPEEASAYCGLGRTTLYGFLRTRELRSAKVGARRYVRRADLEEFMSRFIEN